MAIMLARLLVMAKLLTVAEFALYSAAMVVSGIVGMLACVGLYHDLQRTMPGHLAHGRRRQAAIATSRTIIGGLIVAGLGLALSAFGHLIDSLSSMIVALGVLHGLAQQLFLVATTESRSNHEPLRFAWQSMARAVGVIGAAVPAALWSGSASAVVAAEAAMTFVIIALILHKVLARLSDQSGLELSILGWRSLRSVDWAAMFSLLLLSAAVAISSNIDRWLASTSLTLEDFGQYSFAWITLSVAFSAQSLVNAAAYAVIARRAALAGHASAYRVSFATSMTLLLICLAAVPPAAYIASALVDRFYPEYRDAVVLLPFFGIAAAFRVADFWSGFLVIVGKERLSLAINLAATIVPTALMVINAHVQERSLTAKDLCLLAAIVAAATFLWSFLGARSHARKVPAPVAV